MSSPDDHCGEMPEAFESDDRRVEDVLHGRSHALGGADGHLAEVFAGLRTASIPVRPEPNDELSRVFAEGLAAPSEEPAHAPAAAAGTRRRRSRTRGPVLRGVVRPIAANLAALSLLAKLTFVGGAVAATAVGGAGAAGVLPGHVGPNELIDSTSGTSEPPDEGDDRRVDADAVGDGWPEESRRPDDRQPDTTGEAEGTQPTERVDDTEPPRETPPPAPQDHARGGVDEPGAERPGGTPAPVDPRTGPGSPSPDDPDDGAGPDPPDVTEGRPPMNDGAVSTDPGESEDGGGTPDAVEDATGSATDPRGDEAGTKTPDDEAGADVSDEPEVAIGGAGRGSPTELPTPRR